MTMDTATIIKARFLEAAYVALGLPSKGSRPAAYGRAWPAYTHSRADMNGWGDVNLREHRAAFWDARPRSTAAEISRHDECLDWTADLITSEVNRTALWAWAFCSVQGKSFRGWCRANDVVPMTAYRRVDRAIAAVSSKFCKSSHELTSPGDDWLLRLADNSGMNYAKVGDGTGRSQEHWRASDADPASSDDEFVQRLALAQQKRREKLGLVA